MSNDSGRCVLALWEMRILTYVFVTGLQLLTDDLIDA